MEKQEMGYTLWADRVIQGLQEEFTSFYCKKDFRVMLKELQDAKHRSSYPSKLRRLWDMLASQGVPFERYDKSGKLSYYEELVEGLELSENIEDLVVQRLYTSLDEYPLPGKYMERLVDRLSDPADGWGGEPLRLRILKQFLKYGGSALSKYPWDLRGKAAVKKWVREKLERERRGKKTPATLTDEQVLAALDDSIFEVLDTLSKDEIKSNGLLLVQAADDLAGGWFRPGGATRKRLYLFAMVYNMTYYSGAAGAVFDRSRDLEHNLFRDYYNNHLMLYLSQDAKKRAGGFEMDPSGQTINYKNFAEVVCVYYISRDMEPEEKVRRAGEMIERIKKAAPADTKASPPRGGTAYFRRLLMEDVLKLSEGELERFLLENYPCHTGGKSVFQLENEQNTAFAEYTRLLRELEELEGAEKPEEQASGKPQGRELWLAEAAAEAWIEGCPKEVDPEKYDRFRRLIEGAAPYVEHGFREKESAEEVTRGAVLTACYHLYVALNRPKGDLVESPAWQQSFQNVLEDFRDLADPRLEACGYQPLSEKNILDVLLAFSAYAQLNDW